MNGMPNTIAFMSLPYPPKMTRLRLDPFPATTFQDKTEDISSINAFIKTLNKSGDNACLTGKAPGLATHGITKLV